MDILFHDDMPPIENHIENKHGSKEEDTDSSNDKRNAPLYTVVKEKAKETIEKLKKIVARKLKKIDVVRHGAAKTNQKVCDNHIMFYM